MQANSQECSLHWISENPYACEGEWKLAFVALILSLFSLIGMVIWMIRTSYLLRLQRESGLLEDVSLGNQNNTCCNCGSIVSKDSAKYEAPLVRLDRMKGLERDLPVPQACNFCALISTVRSMAISESFFICAGFFCWFAGASVFFVWFFLICANIYTLILVIIFTYTFFTTSSAVRGAMLFVGGEIRRRHRLIEFENDRENLDADSEAVLASVSEDHKRKAIKLLSDDEVVLYAEAMDYGKISYRNYSFAMNFAFLACISPVFLALGIYGAVKTAAVAATLPFLIAGLMWLPLLNDFVPKGNSSYIITNKRIIHLVPGLLSYFFGVTVSSVYFAKMDTILIRKLGREEDSSVGSVIWMQGMDGLFTRINYVSDMFHVARIILNCRKKFESLEGESDQSIQAQLPPLEQPEEQTGEAEIKRRWYLRLFSFVLGAACPPLFWLAFKSALAVFMGFAIGAFAILSCSIYYQMTLYQNQVKCMTLRFTSPDTLPSQQTL